MRALGLDVGAKTIGLAVSDPEGVLATAWEVHARVGEAGDVDAIVTRARTRDVGTIVVGWPLELDGSVGRRAKRVDRFIVALRERLEAQELAMGIELWDERFSTAAAERTLLEADMSRARRKATIDAVAAQFILQGWLDAQRSRAEVAGG